MAILKTTAAPNWTGHMDTVANPTTKETNTFGAKYLAFVDGQQKNRTLWFLIILSVHAAVFLPVPIMLIGYFNAPVAILTVTMVSFFANFVANMGGSGIRTTITFFFASILIHLVMIAAVILL